MTSTMPADAPKTATHPACGKTWPNVSRNSHCPGCHQTFSSHKVADRHRRNLDGERVCVDPALLNVDGHTPVLVNGVWKSGRKCTIIKS